MSGSDPFGPPRVRSVEEAMEWLAKGELTVSARRRVTHSDPLSCGQQEWGALVPAKQFVAREVGSIEAFVAALDDFNAMVAREGDTSVVRRSTTHAFPRARTTSI